MFWNGQPVFDGPATNALAHWLNNLMYLGGSTQGEFGSPVEVYGEAYRANHSVHTYDTAFLAGQFPCGTTFRVGFSHASSETVHAELTAEGDQGTLTLNELNILSSDGIQLPDQKPFEPQALLRNFIDFAATRISRPLVTLQDVMGYTLATNLMFQSSGGIHDIPPDFCREVPGPNGERVCHLENGAEQLRKAVADGQGLRAAGAPWGISSKTLGATELNEGGMLSQLGQQFERW